MHRDRTPNPSPRIVRVEAHSMFTGRAEFLVSAAQTHGFSLESLLRTGIEADRTPQS